MKKKFLALFSFLFALFAVFAFTQSVFAMEPYSDVIYDGIDVSEWQGEIDFERVRDAGKEVVYIRSSVGSSYIDPYFERNYEGAKASGLKVGVYHYTTARNTAEAREEARFFASVIGGKNIDCKPAMDFEYFPGLTRAQATAIGEEFTSALAEYSGKEPAIYSDAYNARNTFGGDLGRYALWIAEYGAREPQDSPTWDSWSGWQYSDRGRVDGIEGFVDLDDFTEGMFLSEDDATVPTKEHERVINYRVEPGDTLWGLARKYGTTVSELVSLNNIADPNRIYVGEIIKIPFGDYNYSTYTVRPGDTLWGIARRFDTTVTHLAGINDITNPDLIYPGEIIKY